MKKFYLSLFAIIAFTFSAKCQTIDSAEYFIDTDPGFGNGTTITFASDDTISINNIAINSTGLNVGYHNLYVRVKDSNGYWGNYRRQRFYVFDNSPIIPIVDSVKLIQAEYWIDSIPIPGTGNLITLNPKDTIFYNDSIPGLQLDTGSHFVSVRVKDTRGNWSFVKTDSVRTEFYDLDISVVSRPFIQRGGWEKCEVTLKNRGNKNLYDIFLVLFSSKIDSIRILPETDSILNVDVSNVDGLTNFNDQKFASIWLYSLLAQAQIKFNIYLRFASLINRHDDITQEFEVYIDQNNLLNSRFIETGDTSFLKDSRLFYCAQNAIHFAHDSILAFTIPDSIVDNQIDNALKESINFSDKPVLVNRILKSIIKSAIDTLMSDSISGLMSTYAFETLRSSFFPRSESALRVTLPFCTCQPCPSINSTCASQSAPLKPENKFAITSESCKTRCYCMCAGQDYSNFDQCHEGTDIAMLHSSPEYQDWMDGNYEVKAVFSGRVVFEGILKGYGNAVIVKSCINNIGDSITTLYAHLHDIVITNNSNVDAGITIIGHAGNSGTDHVHLHLEFRGANGLLDSPLDGSCIVNSFGYHTTTSTEKQCSRLGPVCKIQYPLSCPTVQTHLGACNPNSIVSCIAPGNANPSDPNDKVGNEGYASSRYIKPTDELHYGIFFQNVDSATASARVVQIIDTLDLSKVDKSTLYLESITAGEMLFVLPDGVHIQNLDTIYQEEPINGEYVHLQASFDTTSGVIQFILTSLDTATLQPDTNILHGFLPPDTSHFNGNGLVSYKIMPVSTIPNDTVIYNTAHIIFDSNAPIATGTWFNTIDRIEPVSSVSALPIVTTDTSFTVHWTGADAGAGIVAYDIYSKTSGDTAFTKWLSYTSLLTDTFHGVWDSTYQFYSIAYDSVGNVENKLTLVEAYTILQNPVGIHYIFNSSDLKVYPNPTSGKLTIEAMLLKDGKLNLDIFDLLGQKLFSFDDDGTKKKYLKKEIDLSNQTDGVYLIRLNNSGYSVTKKFILKKN